jgi:hypothetical protein
MIFHFQTKYSHLCRYFIHGVMWSQIYSEDLAAPRKILILSGAVSTLPNAVYIHIWGMCDTGI